MENSHATADCKVCSVYLMRLCSQRSRWFRAIREPLALGMRAMAWIHRIPVPPLAPHEDATGSKISFVSTCQCNYCSLVWALAPIVADGGRGTASQADCCQCVADNIEVRHEPSVKFFVSQKKMEQELSHTLRGVPFQSIRFRRGKAFLNYPPLVFLPRRRTALYQPA